MEYCVYYLVYNTFFEYKAKPFARMGRKATDLTQTAGLHSVNQLNVYQGARMRPLKHTLVLCLVSLSITTLFAKVERWDTFAKEKAQEQQVSTRTAQIVIVRPENVSGKAINIYIDGEYVSSLLPGAYTEELVCSGRHRVNLAYTNIATRYKEKRTGGDLIDFKSGEKNLYAITKENGKLRFKHYPKQDIPSLLTHYTKRQAHTISRLSKRKCTQPSKSTRK